MKRFLTSALVVAALALPLAARAADVPSYAVPAPSGDERIQGMISALNGKYGLSVRDNRGYIDNVTMHQGTIINPTGLQLAPGMQVTVLGHPEGGTFDANEVDTPYTEVQAVYPYGYYPGGWGFGWGGWGGGFRGHFGGRW